MLEPPSIYANIVTLIKNLLRQYGRAKEKKRYMYRAIETNRKLYRIIQEQRSKRRLLSYNKTTNHF